MKFKEKKYCSATFQHFKHNVTQSSVIFRPLTDLSKFLYHRRIAISIFDFLIYLPGTLLHKLIWIILIASLNAFFLFCVANKIFFHYLSAVFVFELLLEDKLVTVIPAVITIPRRNRIRVKSFNFADDLKPDRNSFYIQRNSSKLVGCFSTYIM